MVDRLEKLSVEWKVNRKVQQLDLTMDSYLAEKKVESLEQMKVET
jgi:hypothetical protein